MKKSELDIRVEMAQSRDAEDIVRIRDEAWAKSYPNAELGITREQIVLNARGKNGVFAVNRTNYLRNYLKDQNDTWKYYVARNASAVVGYVCLETMPGNLTLQNIYVDPKYQGHGVGTKLIEQALLVLGGRAPIELEVVSYNQRAIDFYMKFGFEIISEPITEVDPEAPDYVVPLPQVRMRRVVKV